MAGPYNALRPANETVAPPLEGDRGPEKNDARSDLKRDIGYLYNILIQVSRWRVGSFSNAG